MQIRAEIVWRLNSHFETLVSGADTLLWFFFSRLGIVY